MFPLLARFVFIVSVLDACQRVNASTLIRSQPDIEGGSETLDECAGAALALRAFECICKKYSVSNQCARLKKYAGLLTNYSAVFKVNVELEAPSCGHTVAAVSLEQVKEEYCADDRVQTVSYFEIHNSAFMAPKGNVVVQLHTTGIENMCVPYLTGERKIDPSSPLDVGVLMRLQVDRDWAPLIELPAWDRPWEKKRSRAVWRGPGGGECTLLTTPGSRGLLIEKWGKFEGDQIDVGYDYIAGCPTHESKGRFTPARLLENRFIVVLDDVGPTGDLNFVLASRSLPLIVEKRTWETWLLESRLEAWVHYVPIKPNFSDLLEKTKFMTENPDKAEHIANMGREYMKQFSHEITENRMQAAVLEAYLSRVGVHELREGEARHRLYAGVGGGCDS